MSTTISSLYSSSNRVSGWADQASLCAPRFGHEYCNLPDLSEVERLLVCRVISIHGYSMKWFVINGCASMQSSLRWFHAISNASVHLKKILMSLRENGSIWGAHPSRCATVNDEPSYRVTMSCIKSSGVFFNDSWKVTNRYTKNVYRYDDRVVINMYIKQQVKQIRLLTTQLGTVGQQDLRNFDWQVILSAHVRLQCVKS